MAGDPWPDQLQDVWVNCRLRVPPEQRRAIALVGAGAIADVAHLPAYTAGGLEVVGIFDVDSGRAKAVAGRHGVERVYGSLDELLGDPGAEVIDIAIPAAEQPAVIRRCLDAGRHVLGQKPFAPSPEVALSLAEYAAERGLTLVVNQQLRFDEGIAAAHRMVELGWLGELTHMSIYVDIWTEWTLWPWMLTTPRLEVMNHSVHYHDVMRWFLGEPETVYCASGRTPGQAPLGETRTITTCRYRSGATSLVHANHENDRGEGEARFRIDGARGSIRGTLGLLYDYPSGRPDTLEVFSTVLPTDGWVPYPVTTRWIPDAFLGPMASLLDAVATGSLPRTNALDNVETLRVAEAIYASMEDGEVHRPGSG
jgi:predicted dehydrogenase